MTSADSEALKLRKRALEQTPDNDRLWHTRALLELGLGDAVAYRATCAAMSQRFTARADPDEVNWVAWTCALSPDSGNDWATCVCRAELAVAKGKRAKQFIYTQGTA